MFGFHEMDLESATAIAAWTYPEPYDLYNTSPERRGEVAANMVSPALGYERILDGAADLFGFWCGGTDARVRGGTYGPETLDVGLGMRPERVGQGHGRALAAAVLERARRSRAPLSVGVTIAAFNGRALRVWRDLGFAETNTFRRSADGREFVQLSRST